MIFSLFWNVLYQETYKTYNGCYLFSFFKDNMLLLSWYILTCKVIVLTNLAVREHCDRTYNIAFWVMTRGKERRSTYILYLYRWFGFFYYMLVYFSVTVLVSFAEWLSNTIFEKRKIWINKQFIIFFFKTRTNQLTGVFSWLVLSTKQSQLNEQLFYNNLVPRSALIH